MNILVIITFVEMFLLLVYGYFLARNLLVTTIVTSVAASAIYYQLQEKFAYFNYGVTSGAEVTKSKFMKAAVFSPQLGEEIIAIVDEYVLVPNHNEKQALIKVHAASVNPVDHKVNTALIPFYRLIKKHIPGYDIAGTVVSVGTDPSCNFLSKYDPVFGFTLGAYAEYARVFCLDVTQKPKALTHAEASTLTVAFLTTIEAFDMGGFSLYSQMLPTMIRSFEAAHNRKLLPVEKKYFDLEVTKELKKGKKMEEIPGVADFFASFGSHVSEMNANKDRIALIVGGSGGCGMFGVQMAKLYGFKEIISINSKRNNKIVTEMGATKIVDYKDQFSMLNFLDEYKERVNFIYDTVSSGSEKDHHYYEQLKDLLHTSDQRKYIAINGNGQDYLSAFSRRGIVNILDSVTKLVLADWDLEDILLGETVYDLFLTNVDQIKFRRATSIFEYDGFEGKVVIDSKYHLKTNSSLLTAFQKSKGRRTIGKVIIEP